MMDNYLEMAKEYQDDVSKEDYPLLCAMIAQVEVMERIAAALERMNEARWHQLRRTARQGDVGQDGEAPDVGDDYHYNYAASDFAYDAEREDRAFGFR